MFLNLRKWDIFVRHVIRVIMWCQRNIWSVHASEKPDQMIQNELSLAEQMITLCRPKNISNFSTGKFQMATNTCSTAIDMPYRYNLKMPLRMLLTMAVSASGQTT